MSMSTQKLVWIALWSDPYSCSQIAHFASSLARPGVVNIRLIVDVHPASLSNVIIPTGSRLWSDRSAIKLMIGALSSCVNVVLI